MKRRSDADRIIAFFTDAPLDTARLMLDIVSGIMRRRTGETKPPRKQRSDAGQKRSAQQPLEEHANG